MLLLDIGKNYIYIMENTQIPDVANTFLIMTVADFLQNSGILSNDHVGFATVGSTGTGKKFRCSILALLWHHLLSSNRIGLS